MKPTLEMPAILYGTAWKKERTAELVEQALALGFRGIDTACQPRHYHEPGVGEGIARSLGAGLRRDQLYLQTKFTPPDGQDRDTVPYDPRASAAEQVRQSFACSLRNLRTDYLDAQVLHSPVQPFARLLEVWSAMEELHDSALVLRIGISNCYSLELLRSLYEAARVKPAIVQNRFYAKTGYDRELRAFCRAHAIVYQSFWTLTANPHLLAHRVLSSLAARHAVQPAQVLFRFLSQSGVVPLTGTTSSEHMRQDLAAFELTSDEHAAIDRLLAAC